MPDTKPAPILSATVLLLRDAPDLQVLMVKRHYQIDFAAGALVFPGGKTNPEDSADDWDGLSDGDEINEYVYRSGDGSLRVRSQ